MLKRFSCKDIYTMRRNNWLVVLVFFVLSLPAGAQKKPTKKPARVVETKPVVTKPDAAADEKKVRDMVAFLEFMLNTLGNSSTPIRDKEILITESYAKIFRDSKVQVEDDLDNERKVITNKDVVAYLKDVNFFFHDVRFEFTIESITSSTLPDGQTFYKVTTSRNLKGNTANNTPVNSTLARYIEINYNPSEQDLKIVSLYTHEFDEKVALTSWWKDMPTAWQSVFIEKLVLSDSVSLTDLKTMSSLTELDISNNRNLQDLTPLSQLVNLTSLNLSGTTVSDLTPIRNLTELVKLTIENTSVKDLSPLKYSNKITTLILNNTDVEDITVLEKMPALKHVEMQGTMVANFMPLAKLLGLYQVDISKTKITSLTPFENLLTLTNLTLSNTLVDDVEPLKNLRMLTKLTIDSTEISTLEGLGSIEMLKTLSINNTAVSDLAPLQKLVHLEKIYCDNTSINQQAAAAFMALHPKVLVIFDSEDLKVWWNQLPKDWQTVFFKSAGLEGNPTKEELAIIPLLDSINLSGDKNLVNLEPLSKLKKLKVLLANKTSISDLEPLRELSEITYLDISGTNVSDLDVLTNLTHLTSLKADDCKIKNIEKLTFTSLDHLYADNSGITDDVAAAFLKLNPACLLVYKTDTLKTWWGNLSETWQEAFTKQLGKDPNATRENLHTLVEQKKLEINNASIKDLTALSEYIQLQELHFSGTVITNITLPGNIYTLKSLHATNSPIKDVKSLTVLTELEDLDVSNTPIEDVSELWKLKKLTKLNCAGTQIKKLDALKKMENLTYMDCSNTNVSKLSALNNLSLKTLKCFNTKIPNRVIENFKASHPECDVVYYR